MEMRTRRLKAIAISAAPLAVFIVVVLAAAGVGIDRVASIVGPYLAVSAIVWAVVLIGLLLAALVTPFVTRTFEESPWRLVTGVVRTRWADDYGLSLVWPALLFGLLFGFLAIFKQTVLRRHGFADDATFAALDRLLFFGIDPWRVTHALPAPWTTLVLDRVYAIWYVPVIGVLLPCAFLRESVEIRTRYLLAFVLCWTVIGGLMAFLLPSSGPCYAETFHPWMTQFRPLEATLRRDAADLARLVPDTRFLASGAQDYLLRLHNTGTLGFAGGISAMPSMHVAQATLIAVAAFRVGRVAGGIATVYAAMVFIGSVHLGWHYAVDGIVGAALAAAIWYLSGLVVKRILGAEPAAPDSASAS